MESLHATERASFRWPSLLPLIAHRQTPVSLERFYQWLRYHRSQTLGSLLINKIQGDNLSRRG